MFTQSDRGHQYAVVGDQLAAFGLSWMPAEKFSTGARYERAPADDNDLETGGHLSAGLLF
ncbi:MAG: hypothetical protein RRB13_02180 [bacterium]|nr:hypothetical protein [bacterium]